MGEGSAPSSLPGCLQLPDGQVSRSRRSALLSPGKFCRLGEYAVRDEPQFIGCVLRVDPTDTIRAVIEVKDESHSPGAGMQQTLAYATDVSALFALVMNGHAIVEQGMLTGAVCRHLRELLRAGTGTLAAFEIATLGPRA